MDSANSVDLELCTAEYTATLVQVPDDNPAIFVFAHGEHRTSGFEVAFHKSPQDVYPPKFTLWHFKLPGRIPRDVVTPFTKVATFKASGKSEKVIVVDATGQHEVPIQSLRTTGEAFDTTNAHLAIQTAYGEKVVSPAARTQPCYSVECADRRLLSVTLPTGATYVATHYFTNAAPDADKADVYETGPGEVAWGQFSIATPNTNNHNQVVFTAYYFNRSNRDRLASINVDYLP